MIDQLLDLLMIGLVHIGNYFKIQKNKIGWLISMIAITYFIVRSFWLGLYSQSFGHCISFSMAMYGFIKWYKNERT